MRSFLAPLAAFHAILLLIKVMVCVAKHTGPSEWCPVEMWCRQLEILE